MSDTTKLRRENKRERSVQGIDREDEAGIPALFGAPSDRSEQVAVVLPLRHHDRF